MAETAEIPYRQIRASYDDTTIVVYQAYNTAIADAAIKAQKFVAPFSVDRMTWIKPSFRWMMYRCGFASKPGQERVLAIRIKRSGFERALQTSCVSMFGESSLHKTQEEFRTAKDASLVTIQWDPERDLEFKSLNHRSLQIGLGRKIVDEYINDWIVAIDDVTEISIKIGELVAQQKFDEASLLLPVEREYPVPESLFLHLGMDITGPQPHAPREEGGETRKERGGKREAKKKGSQHKVQELRDEDGGDRMTGPEEGAAGCA